MGFLGFGRRRQFTPPINQLNLDVRLPGGDRLQQRYDQGTVQVNPMLSKSNQTRLNWAQRYLYSMMNQLARTPASDRRLIEAQQKAFFDQKRQAINESTDLALAKTQSDLAHRFGGSMASTFGNDLLGRIEQGRARAVSEAQGDAILLGRQLYDQLDAGRLRRINALQGYMGGLQSPTYGLIPDAIRSGEIMRQALMRQMQQDEAEDAMRFSDIANVAASFARAATMGG